MINRQNWCLKVQTVAVIIGLVNALVSTNFSCMLWKTTQHVECSVKCMLLRCTVKQHWNRVRTHLESPWKSLNLKIKIQSLESPWKVHWVFEKPWNLLFDCFHVVEELEKPETWTNLAVIPWPDHLVSHSNGIFYKMECLKNWNCALECPWKVLEFLVPKRVQTLLKSCSSIPCKFGFLKCKNKVQYNCVSLI